MRTSVPSLSALLLACLAAAGTPAAPALRTARHGPLRIAQVTPDGGVTSPNWSGYSVTGLPGSVTAVSGSWIVPQASCGGTNPNYSGASHWVGIDGYNNGTVEQTGTEVDCSAGQPRYYAWYEFYPKPGVTITSVEVQPGDPIFASVTYGNGEFTATLTNGRTWRTFSVTAAVPTAKRDSAEWIGEANSIHFTNFGTAFFGEDQTGLTSTCTATFSGRTEPIGRFPPYRVHPITLVDPKGTTLAVTSPLSRDGTSFSVQWQAAR